MNLIYHITRIGRTGYDEAAAFIVVAPHESTARSYAATQAGDEGGTTWLDPTASHATMIGQAQPGVPIGVTVRDFRAG